MKQNLSETTLTTKQIFHGNMLTLQVDQVKLPDGNITNREIVKHPGAVAILPITKNGDIIFVEQYRKPLERTLLEIPAGKIEVGEENQITALRELEEETGYTTSKLTYITSFCTSPGFANEIIYLFYTEDLRKMEHKVKGDDDEFIHLKILSLEEAEKYMNEQQPSDIKTMYALLYLKQLRLGKKC